MLSLYVNIPAANKAKKRAVSPVKEKRLCVNCYLNFSALSFSQSNTKEPD